MHRNTVPAALPSVLAAMQSIPAAVTGCLKVAFLPANSNYFNHWISLDIVVGNMLSGCCRFESQPGPSLYPSIRKQLLNLAILSVPVIHLVLPWHLCKMQICGYT